MHIHIPLQWKNTCGIISSRSNADVHDTFFHSKAQGTDGSPSVPKSSNRFPEEESGTLPPTGEMLILLLQVIQNDFIGLKIKYYSIHFSSFLLLDRYSMQKGLEDTSSENLLKKVH